MILLTGGGVCLSACWDTHPPGADTPLGADPPRADTPPEQTPPRADTPRSRHPPPPRSRHPLAPRSRHPVPPGVDTPHGADTLPTEHAGRYGQRAGGTHPTGMQSCSIHLYYLTVVVPVCLGVLRCCNLHLQDAQEICRIFTSCTLPLGNCNNNNHTV